ncbi:MAG: helix-turn-helix transcriptional regulator [Bacilli bacterium]|nr:helix-turn-helix transcriptional regulator [Bacilli bacterium]
MSRNEFSCDCNVIHQNAVDEVLQSMPSRKTLDRLAELYKLIGDTTRCRILFALNQKEMCVCDLANVLNMTKSSTSHQLAVLRNSEVVRCRKSGKEVYYTLDDDHIVKLFEIGLEHINHKDKK